MVKKKKVKEQCRGHERVQKIGWRVNYYLWVTLNILHFKSSRLGISHFHLHVKVNSLAKQTAVEWKVPGRLMRCVFPLFHTIPLFIPLCLSVRAV